MKRLIKYWSIYNDVKFSDCSTKYELFPVLVDDDAGAEKLLELANELGLDTRTKDVSSLKTGGYKALEISHSVELSEIKFKNSSSGIDTEMIVRLGFITIPKSNALKVSKRLNKSVTLDQANDIINSQELGVYDIAEIRGASMIVMSGWDYYHAISVLGYSLKSFEKHYLGRNKGLREFSDSVSRCDECGEWDYNDDSYTSNFRVVNCELYGVNCGCYAKACIDEINSFIDDPKQCIEREAAEDLVKAGRLVKVETFVGGLTDRGLIHNYNGKRVRTSNPEAALKEFKTKFPKAGFVFVHEQSGQFQTYYTIYKVRKTPMIKAKAA